MNEFNNESSDGWDWEWFMYGGTVILNRDEEKFWRMTPREFNSLMRIHIEINDPKSKKNKQLTPIDKISGL